MSISEEILVRGDRFLFVSLGNFSSTFPNMYVPLPQHLNVKESSSRCDGLKHSRFRYSGYTNGQKSAWPH